MTFWDVHSAIAYRDGTHITQPLILPSGTLGATIRRRCLQPSSPDPIGATRNRFRRLVLALANQPHNNRMNRSRQRSFCFHCLSSARLSLTLSLCGLLPPELEGLSPDHLRAVRPSPLSIVLSPLRSSLPRSPGGGAPFALHHSAHVYSSSYMGLLLMVLAPLLLPTY